MELLLLFILPVGAMILVALIPDEYLNIILESPRRKRRAPSTITPAEASPRDDEPWPYYAKPLMTDVEQIFFHRLLQVLPNHRVFAQVQLSQLLGIRAGHNYHRWYHHVSRMSVDYVVCSKDARILAAIELDDSSHLLPDRILADQKKDRALSAAGISILRIPVKGMPGVSELSKLFAFLDEAKTAAPEAQAPAQKPTTAPNAPSAPDPSKPEPIPQNPWEATIPPLSLPRLQPASTALPTPDVAI